MLLKASKFFLYVSVFSILIVLTTTFFPFIGGKYYFYRTATELALLCFVLWWGFQAKAGEAKALFSKISDQPLFLAVSAFVAAFMLATLFANDMHAAFWSNFERGDGGFQMIHYYIFFVLAVMLFASDADWKRLFRVAIIAATCMILYGVIGYYQQYDRAKYAGQKDYVTPFCYLKTVAYDQGRPRLQETCPINFITPYQGESPRGFWKTLTVARFQGSLGNPAYVAPYLFFAMFYALSLWAHPSKRTWLGTLWIRHVFYGAIVTLFLFFFALSQTRGAFIGLSAALFAFFAYLLFSWPHGRRKIFLALAFVVLLFGTLFYYRDTKFVKELPGGRFFSVSLSDQTIRTRAWTWNSAWQGFKERPILGWGPENFSAVFDKYFDPRHYIPGTDSETWFDRAHNVVFDYLAETGIIGFLSYVGIFAVFFYEFARKMASRRRGEPHGQTVPANRFEHALLIALPVGYLVQGLALFDVLPIYLNLFLFLAFATYLFSRTQPAARNAVII